MSESLLGVVDTYMVSQLGVIEIGAVGLGAMLAWLFYLPVMGLAMGLNTFVAQSYGARKMKDCGFITWQGLYLFEHRLENQTRILSHHLIGD